MGDDLAHVVGQREQAIAGRREPLHQRRGVLEQVQAVVKRSEHRLGLVLRQQPCFDISDFGTGFGMLAPVERAPDVGFAEQRVASGPGLVTRKTERGFDDAERIPPDQDVADIEHDVPDHSEMPSCHRMKANSSAVSCRLSKRPDLPPWPAPMLVLSSSTLSSVFISRRRATHLAGSQYVTRGSLSPAVTSIGG